MNVVYFDCFSGAAGDMILGALLDAGAPVEDVRAGLDKLGMDGWSLTPGDVERGALRATKVEVDGSGPARTYRDIASMIDAADLAERPKGWALAAFRWLAEAEGRVHGVSIDDVVLHEVGALDAIVDIVGSCLALEHFAPGRVVCSPLPIGRGTIRSDHGLIPLPAPAVVEILAARGIPTYQRGGDELVTPTGAAIVAATADSFGDIPEMTLFGVGYGAGDRDTELPNVVRVLVGEAADRTGAESAVLVETNVDDMSPELIPHVLEAMLEAGAFDAWYSPIAMKKGRPGLTLSALVPVERRDALLDALFRETTTLGVRLSTVAREVLDRSFIEVEVEGLPVRVKVGRREGEVVTTSPEFEDARTVAHKTGLPLKQIYALAQEEARRRL
jgi:uncharacterized protein (TIGR00299 family) protein